MASQPGVYPASPFKKFCEALDRSLFSFLAKPVQELKEQYGAVYGEEAEAYFTILKEAFPDKPWPKWALEGFIRLNREILREEKNFNQSGNYTLEGIEFEVAKEQVYDNPEVMEGFYLVGLYLSYFLWPHHYDLFNFYKAKFIKTCEGKGVLMEWGVGHGLLGIVALKQWPDIRKFLAYDVSRYSLDFSRKMLSRAGFSNCTFFKEDVLQAETSRVDYLICGEMLEHVNDPEALLVKALKSLKPGGKLFLTAAVNAAQKDHLFLFRSPGEVYRMVENTGFTIISSTTLVHPLRKNESRPPQVVGLVVEHY